MTKVVVHIEELVLHGFDATSRYTVGDAIRAEIERRLGEGMVPEVWRRGAAIERIEAGEVRLPAAPRGAVGVIGAAVHRGLMNPDQGNQK